MDDSGQLKNRGRSEKVHHSGQEPVDSALNPTIGGSESSQQSTESTTGLSDQDEETANDRASRMDAAKAFYRAMYAGEDVGPEQFGIELQPARPSEARSSCSNCAQLQSELSEIQQKAAEAENLYRRMAADFENYRRRIEREREEFQGLGIQRAVEAILPALDDLDRAKATLSNVNDPKSVTESLNLVYNRFSRCLEQIGIKPLEVIGEQFDPRFHEPVQQIPTDEFEEGSVMHELRRGYAFGQKVLRPSLVNVASAADADKSEVVEPQMVEEEELAKNEEMSVKDQKHSNEVETSEPAVIDLSVMNSKGQDACNQRRAERKKIEGFDSPPSEPDMVDAPSVEIVSEEESDVAGESLDISHFRAGDAKKPADGAHSRDRTKFGKRKEPPTH